MESSRRRELSGGVREYLLSSHLQHRPGLLPSATALNHATLPSTGTTVPSLVSPFVPLLVFGLASCLGAGCGASDSGQASTPDEDASATSFSSPTSTASATGPGGGTFPKPGERSDAGHSDAATPDDAGDVIVPPGSTCGTANPQTGFIPSLTVRVGSANRTYALTVPAGYDGTKRLPLVFGFHGDGGNGADYRSSFPIEAQGETRAIFAWPNGTNNNGGHSFDQVKNPPQNADVTFFDAMVTAISTTYCVDSTRVYAHGMSGGAYFVNQLGRWRTSALRSVAPMSGGGPFGNGPGDFDSQTGGLKIGGALGAFIVHGQSDGSVDISEAQKTLTYWRAAAKSTPGQAATPPTPCQRQNGGTRPVVYCSIPGLGHSLWTGAAAAVWQFFSSNG